MKLFCNKNVLFTNRLKRWFYCLIENILLTGFKVFICYEKVSSKFMSKERGKPKIRKSCFVNKNFMGKTDKFLFDVGF